MLRWFSLFAIFTVIYGAAVLVWWSVQSERRRQRIVRSLASSVNPESVVETSVLIQKPGRRSSGMAGMMAPGRAPGQAVRIDRLSQGGFLLATLVFALAGFMAGTKITGMVGFLGPVIGAFAGAAVPRAYRARHRDKRLAAIEEQFPEALDFLARSVRAGNAFSIALELLGDESVEPLKSEIMKVTREMALGAGLEDALVGLINRIPLLEVRMFVAAVLLQRETGGNLSEVLSKLAGSVRERLRLRGQVKAASGQGRLTATVLTFMPIVTLGILKLVSPDYIDNLTNDAVGRNLLGGAIVLQIVGYLVMRQMIKVEV
ncbi:MAG: type II secretion system F family protein [Bryobacteraceae bacterium]|jgi:tight adherence protein B